MVVTRRKATRKEEQESNKGFHRIFLIIDERIHRDNMDSILMHTVIERQWTNPKATLFPRENPWEQVWSERTKIAFSVIIIQKLTL